MGDELPTEPTTNTTSAKPKASDCCIADATIPVSVGKEEDEPCVGSDNKKYIGEHSSSACQADVGQRSCLDELPARRSPTRRSPSVDALCRSAAGWSVQEWLSVVDECGMLVQYADALIKNFQSVEQIVTAYTKVSVDGSTSVEPRFFDDLHIKKLGHKRMFERWFARRTS